MPEAVSRMAFLRGGFRKEPPPVRPPWALEPSLFTETCMGAGNCVVVCPQGIIARGADGRPVLSFARGECTFCEKCATSCPSGALTLVDPASGERRAPWNMRAEIKAGCLSIAGTSCRICGERCERRAISFRLAVGGVALPVVDTSLCNGCGACFGPCPNGSIAIH